MGGTKSAEASETDQGGLKKWHTPRYLSEHLGCHQLMTLSVEGF